MTTDGGCTLIKLVKGLFLFMYLYVYLNMILDVCILVVIKFKFLIKPCPKTMPYLISLRHSLQEKKLLQIQRCCLFNKKLAVFCNASTSISK